MFNTARALTGGPSKLLRMRVHRLASGAERLNPGADADKRQLIGSANNLNVDGDSEPDDNLNSQTEELPPVVGRLSSARTASLLLVSPFPQMVGGVGVDGGTPLEESTLGRSARESGREEAGENERAVPRLVAVVSDAPDHIRQVANQHRIVASC